MIIYLILLSVSLLLIIALILVSRRWARATTSTANSIPYMMMEPNARPDAGVPIPEPPALLKKEATLPTKYANLSDKELVYEVLKECYDPEIPVNIYDLGLIYDVQVNGKSVSITMSLTAPGCPSHVSISEDIKNKLMDAGFEDPKVQVVWDPAWTPERITAEGRKVLGI